MCKEYNESREALSALIFKLKEFTEDELELKFKKIRKGKIEIGRAQTIHEFLDELREFGLLEYELGHYKVQEWSEVLA